MESHKYIFRQFGCSRLLDKMFYHITVYVEGKISNLSSSLYHRREIKIEGRIIWIVNRLKLILWFCEIQINMESVCIMCLILTLTRISDKSVEERSSVIKRADIYKNKLFLFFNNIFFNLSMQFDVLREKIYIIRV